MTIITGTADFQDGFQGLLHEQTSVNGKTYTLPVTKLSVDSGVFIDEIEPDVVVASIPPELQISQYGALGKKNAFIRFVLGSRSLGWLNTSVLGDACDYLDTSQALMNTPATGTNLYLVSTSANDAPGDTGARTVQIVYLDANGNQQTRIETMNGTTPVGIGNGYSFIQWMETVSVGGNEVCAGNVTISSISGSATVATTFEKISAGGNRSLSGRYRVPAGYSAYLIDWSYAAIGGTMDARIRADVLAFNRALSIYRCLSFSRSRISCHRTKRK